MSSSTLFLGIDTGGTYTDAVLWSEASGLVAKAKALTTRHDLAIGIAGAVDTVLAQSGVMSEAIKLVSMSTTLATNALVEGQGGRVALVMVGFSETDLSRDGLRAALGSDPAIFCAGGHDVHGKPAKLDLGPLEAELPTLAGQVSAVAVCGQFATRNPEHELAVLNRIASTGLPATASHQLSAQLGGPRRALTTLLNARLISMIERLIAATEGFLKKRGIAAPLMVVRGDGALVSAKFAKARPIETILSGPAASLVGARHLTGADNAMVSDIGGTTTDIAVLEGGRPRLDPNGATVGGYRTMVEAVAMKTHGLGGDSEVSLEEGALNPRILLGPRRLAPLSLAAMQSPAVVEVLQRQLLATNPGRLDGRLAMRTGLPQALEAGLPEADAKLYAMVPSEPVALDRLLTGSSQTAVLSRLVGRGLVLVSGFTPSDAAHVLGLQSNWNAEAARLGAELFARRRDGRGQSVATTPEDIARRVLAAVTRASAEAIFAAAFDEDGLQGPTLVEDELVQRAIEKRQGIVRLALALDRPVIGLGASASLHYAMLDRLVGSDCILPVDADVANALGAVVGQVRVQAEVLVTQPKEGIFRIATGDGLRDFHQEDAAIEAAATEAERLASIRAVEAGAAEAQIEVTRALNVTVVDGQRLFLDARIVAVASGRPRIA